MKIFKVATLIVFSGIFLVTSCQDESAKTQQAEEELIELSLGILDELSKTYSHKDVVVVFSRNKNNQNRAALDFTKLVRTGNHKQSIAIFRLQGETKEAAQLGSFARSTEAEGETTCDGSLSCGKAVKKCLDNGQDAFISNSTRNGHSEYRVIPQPLR